MMGKEMVYIFQKEFVVKVIKDKDRKVMVGNRFLFIYGDICLIMQLVKLSWLLMFFSIKDIIMMVRVYNINFILLKIFFMVFLKDIILLIKNKIMVLVIVVIMFFKVLILN